MTRRLSPALFAGAAVLALAWAAPARAQSYAPTYTPLSRFSYYPYYYFPHNYWPAMGPRWPEGAGMPYMPPPAYQAFPAFREPGWRYEYWQPQRYHRGSHFWLDVF